MTAKKTNAQYVPEATDGDLDGFVQDDTPFERPAGTHIVQEGENILTVATKFLPEGKTRNEYAKELHAANGDFYAGKVVKL